MQMQKYMYVCVSVCVYLRPQTARLRYIPQWSDRWGTKVRNYRKCPGGTFAVPSASTEPHSGLSPPPAPNFNVERVRGMRLRTFVRKKPAHHCRQMFRFNIEIGGRGGMAHTMRKEVPLRGVANFRLPSVAPGPLKGGEGKVGANGTLGCCHVCLSLSLCVSLVCPSVRSSVSVVLCVSVCVRSANSPLRSCELSSAINSPGAP